MTEEQTVTACRQRAALLRSAAGMSSPLQKRAARVSPQGARRSDGLSHALPCTRLPQFCVPTANQMQNIASMSGNREQGGQAALGVHGPCLL